MVNIIYSCDDKDIVSDNYIMSIVGMEKSSSHILVIDDEPGLLDAYKKILGLLYSKVTACSNGIDAMMILQNEKVDIVLTDMNMPNGDGSDVIKYIVDTERHIPVVIVSAYMKLAKMYEEFPCIKFIVKPAQMQDVLYTLNSLQRKSSEHCAATSIHKLQCAYDKAHAFLETVRRDNE